MKRKSEVSPGESWFYSDGYTDNRMMGGRGGCAGYTTQTFNLGICKRAILSLKPKRGRFHENKILEMIFIRLHKPAEMFPFPGDDHSRSQRKDGSRL